MGLILRPFRAIVHLTAFKSQGYCPVLNDLALSGLGKANNCNSKIII